MSDIEEPAAKMSKLDDTAEVEEMDNGQEEWLSEEILTDEEYNPAAEQDQSDSNANTSQEEGNTDSMDQVSQDATNSTGENIERTLNKLQNDTSSSQAELPEELGAFLIRKTDRRLVEEQQPSNQMESELDESTKQSEDDGNDTDDLLRMLGEDNSKKKEVSAVQISQSGQQKDEPHSSDDDDDEYIFGRKSKRLIVTKDGLLHRPAPTHAVPEDTSDREADNHVSSKVSTMSNMKVVKLGSKDGRIRRFVTKGVVEDMSDRDEDSVQKHQKPIIKRETSSDEAMTMRRMFNVHHTKVVRAGGRGINAVKTVTNRVISIDPKNGPSISPPVSSKTQVKFTKLPAKHSVSIQTKLKTPVRALPEREQLDDDEINDELNELESEGEVEGEGEMEEEGGQRLMRPERMDEEVPSDGESHSDEDSYYDEMPSSESEDADDWFTLDIRAERAAEYIPMLGDDAKALLTAEQQRAAARLGALRRSANALVAGRRSLATQLRLARTSLAQLDAALAQ